MDMETNKIKRLAPGVYWVLLWCPQSYILRHLLDPHTPFVLCWNHSVGDYSWRDFHLPLLEPRDPTEVLARIAIFDFVLQTERFLEILPSMSPSIKAVQLKSVPPDYLDMKRVNGKQLYRILAECGWHVLLDTPGNDYGQVMSPKREILEHAIEIVRSSEG